MEKILTYIIYFLIIIAVYVLIKEAYRGDINANTTIGEAATEITNGSVQTIKEMTNDASTVINNLDQEN